jgi:hypothetical protein
MGKDGAQFITAKVANKMVEFLRAMIGPLWIAWTSSIEMLNHDISAARKFDAIVSRVAHTLNRPPNGVSEGPCSSITTSSPRAREKDLRNGI